MKRFFKHILFSGLFFTNISLPQWSTDPNNNLVIAVGWDPHIVSDSAGGCFITYNYESFYPQKPAVERLDKYGYKPWVDRKQILGELPEQWQAQIIEDGEGGVIISYQDNQVIGMTEFITRVRVQRLDSAGNFLWGQTGLRVTLAEIMHGAQKLVSDGNGGCVIMWQDSLANYSINRIDRNGQRVWSDYGFTIGNGQSSRIIRASDGKYYVQVGENVFRINQKGEILNQYSTTLWNIVPDPDGGVVLSRTVGNISNLTLVAQRNDSLGNNLWQEPYVEIADSLDIGTSINILTNNNYYHYGWLGRKNGVVEILQIQSLRNNGTRLFGEGSISLSDSPTLVTSIPIISSYNGSNIYAWTHWDSPQTYNANYARRIDTTGSEIWKKSPVLLNTPSLGYFSMTTDCFGGAISVGYLNSDFAIRALKVSVNGNLGEVIIPVELISFNANVTGDKVELFWQTATETNNSGFEILRFIHNNNSVWNQIGFVEGSGTTTEPKTYSFIDEDITTGIYKYRLKQIDFDGSFEYSTIVEVVVGVPTEYLLEQNFPNPFNSSTIIKYQIPKEGRVRIVLYNILGEKIETLIDEYKNAGIYSLSFNTTDLPSGIYIYTMETNNTVLTKKLTILK